MSKKILEASIPHWEDIDWENMIRAEEVLKAWNFPYKSSYAHSIVAPNYFMFTTGDEPTFDIFKEILREAFKTSSPRTHKGSFFTVYNVDT